MMRTAIRNAVLAAGAVLAVGLTACGSTGSSETVAFEPSAQGTSWSNFGVDNWPDANWRPYAASSPFNQRIPSGTKPLAGSGTMIGQVLRYGPPSRMVVGGARTSDDWGHPTYYASKTDPVYTLRATASSRHSLNGKRIRVPSGAEPAGGGDAHMTIVQPDGWEYDLWQADDVPPGGGTLTFSLGGRVRIDGSGLGDGGTAARFGNLAGMIRAQELRAGRINHALFVVIRCTGDGTGYGHGAHRRYREDSAFVYPAVAGGAPCPAGTPAPPMGARLRLAMSAQQIAALHLPTWQSAILLALARYGGYVGDTGGDGVGFMFESSTMYTSLGRPDPLVDIARDAGLRPFGDLYGFDVGAGVDWQRYLQVVGPPRR